MLALDAAQIARLLPYLTAEETAELDALLGPAPPMPLADYIRAAWPIIEPETAYLHNWHIDAIAEYLTAVTEGQITRLLINMPPRYMKSIAVSVMWPTWEWAFRPSTRWLFASYSGDLATKHSLDRRAVLASAWYQQQWGARVRLASDANLKTEFSNTARGTMTATGFGGSATGKGGNRVVLDDPHDPMQAESDLQRMTTVTTFQRKFSTRLDDKRLGAIVIVMQRLHQRDVSAVALEQGYTHLSLPAEAPTRMVITLPMSGTQITREAGDLLWPAREGPAELAAAKVALGSYGYSGQYQQDPAPAGGGMFQRRWWRFWHYPDRPLPAVPLVLGNGEIYQAPCIPLPMLDEQVQSWDMAFKGLADSDYVAGGVWGRKGADRFLLDLINKQLTISETLTAVDALTTRWPKTYAKLIEDKANGPAVIILLHSTVSGLIAVNPLGGKVARAQACVPGIESGNGYLPHPQIAPWVDDFITQCAHFPFGAHDDMVDQMTQALVRWLPPQGVTHSRYPF